MNAKQQAEYDRERAVDRVFRRAFRASRLRHHEDGSHPDASVSAGHTHGSCEACCRAADTAAAVAEAMYQEPITVQPGPPLHAGWDKALLDNWIARHQPGGGDR